ncbi:MAG: PP2C family protein-serine/threonine phosphatase [bacterium]
MLGKYLIDTEMGIYVLLIIAMITTGIVLLLIQLKSRTRSPSLNRSSYYALTTGMIFILFLAFPAGLENTIQQYWFKWLITLRGDHRPKNPQVVIVEILGKPVENKIISILDMLDRSKPLVIGILSPLYDYGINSDLKIQSVVRNSALVYYHDRYRIDNRTEHQTDSLWNRRFRAQTTLTSRYLKGYNSELLPMYYHSTKSEYPELTALPIQPEDFGLKMIQLGMNNADSLIGNIPVNDKKYWQSMNINYYSSKTWMSPFSTIWYNQGEPWYSEQLSYNLQYELSNSDEQTSSNKTHRRWSIAKYDEDKSQIINYVFVTTHPNGPRYVPLDTIKSIQMLNGKFVIVLFNNSTDYKYATAYATIIQNILDQEFLSEAHSRLYPIIAFVFIIIAYELFKRFSPWAAFGGSFLILVISGLCCIALFVYGSILVNSYPIGASFIASLLFYLPYELVLERFRLIEDRAYLKAELRAAHDMQMGLMPKADPVIPGYDISGVCYPANEVGGDYYDYVWLDEEKNKLGIAVVDVSGKAMKAAITAVMTSGLVYNEISSNESPRTILRKINRPMYLKTDRNVFTALSFAVIDLKTKNLTFSNAGQMRPLLRRDGVIEYIKVEGPRLPLGVQEEVAYNEVSCQLHPGDVLVLFTDGIIEAKNNKDEFWGFEKMEEVVKNLPQTMSAKEISEAMIAEANRFAGTAKQHDDMTVVVVRVQ